MPLTWLVIGSERTREATLGFFPPSLNTVRAD
jgi:hypothetical protein